MVLLLSIIGSIGICGACNEVVCVLQAFIDGWVVMEEKFDDGRWLDIGEVLICQAGHRTFEGFDHPGGLQRIFIGLVFNCPA